MKKNAIEMFVQDIKISLENNCYYAALALALTLPDICGKIMYPEINTVGERYKKWFDYYIGDYEQSPFYKNKNSLNGMPYLNGELCYSLRCAFLHQGENDLRNRKIKSISLDEFTLIIEPYNEFNLYCDSASNINGKHKTLNIQIRNLCNKIIWVIEQLINKGEIDLKKYPFLSISEL